MKGPDEGWWYRDAEGVGQVLDGNRDSTDLHIDERKR